MADPLSLAGPFPWVDEGDVSVDGAALAAAERQRRAVMSRKEGLTTKILEGAGHIPLGMAGAGAGFVNSAWDRAAEQIGDVPSLSTDYDPRRVGASLGAETALNVMGLPGVMSGAPATLASGAIKRTRDLPMERAAVLARAKEQGWDMPWYHGGERMDRFVEKGKIDPKRATSGPMPFFTDNPEVASSYATKKSDTSLAAVDTGELANYFTVSPKALWPGSQQRTPVSVERSWNFLPPETKQEIMDRSGRIGYARPEMGDGPLTLHPAGQHAGPSSADHWAYTLQQNRGNPLSALRDLWHDGGMLVGNESELAGIFRLAGYPHPISEATAPWTEARGVFPAALRMRNPLVTENTDLLTKDVLPSLAQEFRRDRTRLDPYGADMWTKNTRWTPRDWVAHAQEEYAKGSNPYVFTSIPDKVTAALSRRGYDSIIDTGGKTNPDYGHRVAIPFRPDQVRSIHARFDPANEGKGFLLGANAADRKTGAAVVAANADPLSLAPPAASGIRAYHGSPHDFDRFDLSKIGTGEGAQAYGHGLYFAESPIVAKSYRDALERSGDALHVRSKYQDATIDLNGRNSANVPHEQWAAAKAVAQSGGDPRLALAKTANSVNADSSIENVIKKWVDQGATFEIAGAKPGKMYEVNINAKPDQFLDWDRPIAQQGARIDERVGEVLRRSGVDRENTNYLLNNKTGQDVVRRIAKPSFPVRDDRGTPWRASGADSFEDALSMVGGDKSRVNTMLTPDPVYTAEALRKSDIPGIKYLDQGSRTPLSSVSKPQLESQLKTLRDDLANAEAKGVGDPARMRQRIASLENQLRMVSNPTSNFVLFDDSLVDILRKYALPGAVGAGGFGSLVPSGDQ